MKSGSIWDERYYIMSDYLSLAEQLGINLISVLTAVDVERIAQISDGLIIPGSGTNIDPKYYGKAPFDTPEPADEYALDSRLINAFSRVGKPIFGICGGLQAINVFFGGTLKHLDNDVSHRNGDEKLHSINIEEGSFVYEVFGSLRTTVNCYHSWEIEKVALGFDVVARTDDGVIEAIENKECRIYATQWHPEHAFRTPGHVEQKFFENFLSECKKGI